MTIRTYSVSDLTRTYVDHKTGQARLDMTAITSTDDFPSFEAVRDHVLNDLRYQRPQADKMETFGWVPTLYMPSEREFKSRKTGAEFTRFGSWRNGAAEAESLSVFCADVDNSDSARPMVTMQTVASALDGLGCSYFMYTTFSHTAKKPKFRVVIDTDRDLTRVEMLRVAVWLNWTVFGQQADLSIYDPGDFIFAPPHSATVTERLRAAPMSVAAALAKQSILQEQHPGSWSPYLAQKQPRPSQPAPSRDQSSAIERRPANMSVRDHVEIGNPAIFNPAWADFYRDRVVNGSHWETMRSVLGMVWAKASGDLTRGEMDHILRQIDATAHNYFMTRHGEQKAADLIDWIMSLPAEQRTETWSPILERDETGVIVLVKEGECGEGKTHDELKRIAREKPRVVYVVDKIENIEKRRQEFFAIAGRLEAMRFLTREAHSQHRDLRVALQLFAIREELDKAPAGRPAIVFVTQAGAMQMDWSRWGDCEIVFDEVPDTFQLYRINAKRHSDVLHRYVRPEMEDGDCYSLGLTHVGRELARTTDVDDYDKVHHGLCVLLNKPSTHVWVKRAAWDSPSDSGVMEFFAITAPLNLAPFSAVRLLGDEAMKSVTVRAWSQKWNVQFEQINFERRKRIIPTADRVTIKYVSDHRDSSITRFREGDMPLDAWSTWVKQDAGHEPVLWSANDRLKAKVNLDLADHISPKAHGRNDLQHYKRVGWFVAMKASKFEIATLKEVCGLSAQELTEWREYNAMYQFVMRCALRDFASSVPVVIYVFSRSQAQYLHDRLGGRIEKVPGVVIDKPSRCIDAEGAMTDAERQKVSYWRKKMAKAGVSNVRDLPGASKKLTERETRLVNVTFERIALEVETRRAA